MSSEPCPLGVVHGRFQPFHNEHLSYVRLAAAHCEELIVGITNPEPSSSAPEPTDARRHLPEENPYSFWQRRLVVEAVLKADGLTGRVVPFPISAPETLRHYVPAEATHFLRVFDGWGEEKVRRLAAHGYDVVVLEPGTAKTLTASTVRSAMRECGPWQELVPPAAARLLEAFQDETDRRCPA
jgi:cytidyltransferase-like protein